MKVPQVSLSIPLIENLQKTKSCFKEKNKRIRKFKSTSRFFQHAFDNNSGIYFTRQRVREFDELKLNSSNQERNNEEQVINQNKDNTNINNVNGKSEISVFTNCINNNLENINNSAIKDTDNMKEIINKNIDMESNKQKKMLKRMLELKKIVSVKFLETSKMHLLKRL